MSHSTKALLISKGAAKHSYFASKFLSIMWNSSRRECTFVPKLVWRDLTVFYLLLVSISSQLERRRLEWVGHVIRMNLKDCSSERWGQEQSTQSRRKRRMWTDDIKRFIGQRGRTLNELNREYTINEALRIMGKLEEEEN